MLVLTGRTTSGRNPAGKMIKRLESAAAPIPDLKIQINGYSLNSSRLSAKFIPYTALVRYMYILFWQYIIV